MCTFRKVGEKPQVTKGWLPVYSMWLGLSSFLTSLGLKFQPYRLVSKLGGADGEVQRTVLGGNSF